MGLLTHRIAAVKEGICGMAKNMHAKPASAAEVISDNGREGRVEASDGTLSVDFNAPVDGSPAPTPEHLFAAAYAACFHSALKSLARSAHQDIMGSTVIVCARVAEDDSGVASLVLDLRATIPGLSEGDARRLLHQAHDKCPYSRAVRGNVSVGLSLD
jgi:Ohr subfamily peroxiredoxin